MEYLDAGVTSQEKVGGGAWGGVGGSPAVKREGGRERTGRSGSGACWPEEGKLGGRIKIQVRWEVMCQGTGHSVEGGGGGRRSVLVPTISGTDKTAG